MTSSCYVFLPVSKAPPPLLRSSAISSYQDVLCIIFLLYGYFLILNLENNFNMARARIYTIYTGKAASSAPLLSQRHPLRVSRISLKPNSTVPRMQHDSHYILFFASCFEQCCDILWNASYSVCVCVREFCIGDFACVTSTE